MKRPLTPEERAVVSDPTLRRLLVRAVSNGRRAEVGRVEGEAFTRNGRARDRYVK